MYIIIQCNTIQKKHVHGRRRCSAGCALSSSLRISGPAPNTRLTLGFAWRAGSRTAPIAVFFAVGSPAGLKWLLILIFFTTGGHVYVYIR